MKEEITVVETIKAVKGKGAELKKALEEIVSLCRAGQGCLQYDLLEPLTEKEEFLVLMRWKSTVDLQRHESSSYIAEFVRKYDGVLYRDVIQVEWKKVL